MQVAVMQAYIDQESYSNLTIDAALRELLKGFRLPGFFLYQTLQEHLKACPHLIQSHSQSLESDIMG